MQLNLFIYLFVIYKEKSWETTQRMPQYVLYRKYRYIFWCYAGH